MSGRRSTDGLAVFVYGASDGVTQPMIQACLGLVEKEHRHEPDIHKADLAIAPLLTTFLATEEILMPRMGTLVFHPSLLPRHRGGDAIKWAFKLGEAYSGVTWFWPDEGIDSGDICEQEVVGILPGESPREFYQRAVIPAAVRSLGRALEGVASGMPRRVPQQLEHGSYEPRIRK
ncbi:MAG: hypothetical protein FWE08_03750 [Oscillospiraceae bacterium]|nr:hypothetical protein [Oscillospiraceae bacterium]